MIALDTNVLVRLFVADDEVQAARAVRLINEAQSVFVPKSVTLELVWVLTAVYTIPRARISTVLAALAGLPKLELEDRPAVERAIALYEQGFEDFADALHLCSSATATEFATFDRKLIARARKLGAPVAARQP